MFVSAYLYEIFAYSKTFEEHLQHSELVLKRLRAVKLCRKQYKCNSAVNKVEHPGYLISNEEESVDQQKVQDTKDWLRSNNERAV